MINEILLQTIDNLKPLPTTIIKLRDYIDSAGADIEVSKVVDIIQGDPLLTAELLRLANSPFYGFSREIATLQQVVSLLGVNNIKNVAMANAIKGSFTIDVTPYGLKTDEFLAQCAQEANFITNWLSEEDKKLSQMLVPCAMLLRLGVILFSNSLRTLGKDKEFLQELKNNNYKNVGVIENEFIGVDSMSFLAFLFHYWKFDEDLIESISYIQNPHSARAEVQKSAYALGVVNCLFEPHDGANVFNMHKAVDLLNEAAEQGIKFNMENFMNHLTPQMKANLEANEE